MQSVWFPSSSEFVKLLLRTARRVELTRAGASFYERSVRMISELELSKEIVRCHHPNWE
jgi:DNA-binding transcriptional LysR family regulator